MKQPNISDQLDPVLTASNAPNAHCHSNAALIRKALRHCLLFMLALEAISQLGCKKAMDVDTAQKATVAICTESPSLSDIVGSGFIASEDGLVITSDHVIADDSEELSSSIYGIQVKDGKLVKYELKLLKRYEWHKDGRDLAILRITNHPSGLKYQYLQIGGTARVGDPVYVLGYPDAFRHIRPWPLLRQGVIASDKFRAQNQAVYTLDLQSLPGLSGAPVISLRTGKVIALIQGEAASDPDPGFSVAVPLTTNDLEY